MFYKSINWLRGTAIIFVVLSHLNYSKYIHDKHVARFFSDGTLLFIFIAGFLFYHLIDRYDFSSYMKKKLDNVILPYLFISIPVCLLSIFFFLMDKPWFNKIPEFSNVFYLYAYQISTGGTLLEPLWFMPMIILFFVFSPLIYNIMKSRFFGLFVLLSMAFTMSSIRPGLTTPFLSFVHWFGMYLFGGFICKYFNVFVNHCGKIFIISCLMLFLYYYIPGFGPLNDKHVNKLIMVFFFISFFLLLEPIIESIKIIELLANYSFGIFFLHGYINAAYNLYLFKLIGGGYIPLIFTLLSCLFFPILGIKVSHWIIERTGLNINPRRLFGV